MTVLGHTAARLRLPANACDPGYSPYQRVRQAILPTIPAGFRQLFGYRKAGRTRTYGLRVLNEERTELWVVAQERGRVIRSRRLAIFEPSDNRDAFLADVERELRLSGWAPA
jgi:hypothetical protein